MATIQAHTLVERPLILLVEDNTPNARLASGMLKAGGYTPTTASNGAEGLRLARELRPALIVTDLQMDEMDGLTLLRHLHADPELSDIPVVVLTAHALRDHQRQAEEAGCAAFLAKPLRMKPFLTEIEQVLARSHGGEA